MVELEEPEHICGTCKHYDSDNSYCIKHEFEIYEGDSCDDWEEGD